MKLSFGARTDTGKVREQNEDNFLVDRNLMLYVLCDGMGGHAAGIVASATAVNVVHEEIRAHRDVLKRFTDGEPGVTRRHILDIVEGSVQRACYRIWERALRNPRERGMGTTLTMALFCGGRVFIGHVGDSRIYLHRDGAYWQLSEDHSLLAEMLKAGRIRSAEEVNERFRNAVTRAVGVQESVDVDTLDLAVLPGDRFLLCSDGLYAHADDAAMKAHLERSGDDDSVCAALIAHANADGGTDNVTAVVVTVDQVPNVDTDEVRLALRTLGSLILFRYLDYPELLRVMNMCEARLLHDGDSVFRPGEAEDCAYILLRGRVRIRRENVVVAIMEAGSHFGEMALVDSTPRTAEATAIEETSMLLMHRRSFFELMRNNPTLAVKLLWSLVKALTVRLRRTTDELGLLKGLYHSVRPEEVGSSEEWLEPSDVAELPRRARTDETDPAVPRPPLPPRRPPPPPRTTSVPPLIGNPLPRLEDLLKTP